MPDMMNLFDEIHLDGDMAKSRKSAQIYLEHPVMRGQ